ncbi:hypothetical protein [Saccharomonospora piscinae]|uniref:hypothetical protein n=1 Tax=Saccharomonospora piscinae TaxID=687388 RepID=UPI000462F32A|nr:hypothetical protein [Saccharomonospora piscinae]
MKETLLWKLDGETLSAVVFVMDYLQLDFNGSRFTCYVWPVVLTGSSPWHIGDSGYRDALCGLIGDTVESTEENSHAGLVIRFRRGAVAIDPAPEELVGPEIAQLHIHDPAHGDTEWKVWRPGEDTFVGLD